MVAVHQHRSGKVTQQRGDIIAALTCDPCRFLAIIFGEATRDHAPVLGQNIDHVAPRENDVWSHKQMLKVVSHTPIEVEKFEHARTSGAWIDVMRGFVPDDRKLYTWWSYRAADNWKAADRGRRLDHVWASPALEGAASAMTVFKSSRGWQQPSDHVPVIAEFSL